ncbi:metallophosphoesterase [bacterium]|nr:metallophosphoesterase [bacterium]
MRILVISDIHGNLTALEAVLKSAGNVDQTWCLGDLVGYGPDPNECIDKIKVIPNLTCLIGNHDSAALGQIDLQAFNQDARVSISWMKSKLKADSLKFLRSMSDKKVVEEITLVHGSPRDPIWEYMLDVHTAAENFGYIEKKICLVGHTHIPITFSLQKDGLTIDWEMVEAGQIYRLNKKCFLNPGSVGQPRDHDPRAAYAFLDTERNTWQPMRIEYDVESVQKRILKAGLPRKHAARLSSGG